MRIGPDPRTAASLTVMEPLVLSLDEPRELLALVPHLLGFQPRDSAVGVSLRGARGRIGMVARVDLAHLADGDHGPQLARTLATHLARDGARRAVLVLYNDGPFPVAERAAWHAAEAFDVPFGPLEVVVVGAGVYRCLACPPDCCPAEGHPLSDLRSARSGAAMVLAGSVVAPDRESLVPAAVAPPEARRAVARVRRARARALADALADGPAQTARWRCDALAAWRALVGDVVAEGPGRATRAQLLGRVEAGLADRRVRDTVLVSVLPGTGSLPERALRSSGEQEDAELRDAVARLVDPSAAQPPDATLGPARAALEDVVAHGRHGAQAPATTLLATLAWWQGDGARASVLVERALHEDPAYRLAALVRSALDAGLAPGWARCAP